MKSFRDIFDRRHKKSLRLGLLLLSALFISSATALVYGRMIYEKPLSVGNAVSGSTAPTGVGFPPATIFVLAVSGFVISLSVFGFLHEARKHIRNSSGGLGSLPTGPVSIPVSIPVSVTPMQGDDDWEESRKK